LLAMSVHSLFAGLAMSTREKMEISLALNARLGTRDRKVSLSFVTSVVSVLFMLV